LRPLARLTLWTAKKRGSVLSRPLAASDIALAAAEGRLSDWHPWRARHEALPDLFFSKGSLVPARVTPDKFGGQGFCFSDLPRRNFSHACSYVLMRAHTSHACSYVSYVLIRAHACSCASICFRLQHYNHVINNAFCHDSPCLLLAGGVTAGFCFPSDDSKWSLRVLNFIRRLSQATAGKRPLGTAYGPQGNFCWPMNSLDNKTKNQWKNSWQPT
jgi:hypothetical protein